MPALFLPHASHEDAPAALDAAGLARVCDASAAAAWRAVRLGIEAIELHCAHGHLMHEFLSPIANERTDAYGGSLDSRMHFPLEMFEATRAAVPPEVPVWLRVSARDWVPGGRDRDSSVAFAQALKARGCAAIHVGTGGNSPLQKIALEPALAVARAHQAGRARARAQAVLALAAVRVQGPVRGGERRAAVAATSGQQDALRHDGPLAFPPPGVVCDPTEAQVGGRHLGIRFRTRCRFPVEDDAARLGRPRDRMTGCGQRGCRRTDPSATFSNPISTPESGHFVAKPVISASHASSGELSRNKVVIPLSNAERLAAMAAGKRSRTRSIKASVDIAWNSSKA